MAVILLTHAPDMRRNYYGERALAALQALGEVRLNPSDAALTTDALVDAAQGCDVIVSDRRTPGEAAVFERCAQLRAFVRSAVDIRNVDVAAASAAGVLVTHASPGFVASVSELVLGMLVDLGRGVSDASCAYRAGEVPKARMGRQLEGATLGVIGYGSIGKRVVELGRALGMMVLVSDPYATVAPEAAEQVELAELMERAAFVVCLAIANDETENLIDAAALARLQDGACFVNVSRGNLVDEAALAAELRAGRIRVAMDVGRAPDQMPTPELAALPGVVATPHVGGLTPQAIEHQAMETVRQVGAILAGRIPDGAANAEHARKLG